MGTHGIGYDDVAGCADTLVAEGNSPTVRLVRERLTRGSLTTVSKHLDRWRGERQGAAPSPMLPPVVARALESHIAEIRDADKVAHDQEVAWHKQQRDASDRAADALQGQLDEARTENEELSRRMLAAETRSMMLSESVSALKAQLEQTAERCAELDKNAAVANTERKAAQDTIATIEAQLRLERERGMEATRSAARDADRRAPPTKPRSPRRPSPSTAGVETG